MAVNNENFSTMVLHEARELRVRMFAGKKPPGFDEEAFRRIWRNVVYRQARYGNQRPTFHKSDPNQLDKNTLQLAGEQHRPTRRLGAAESKRGVRTTE